MCKPIKEIKAKGFKGISFLESLDRLNLFIAPNGTGKSARSQALQLAVLGFCPSDGLKRAGDIYRAHGADGQPFMVGIHVSHHDAPAGLARFERTYIPTGTGVTCSVTINGKKCKESEVGKVLAKLGDPAIFDLSAFNDLGDQKKIDLIFDLFPPEGDPAKLEAELVSVGEQINTTNTEIGACTRQIQRATEGLAEVHVPAGTLAEVRAEMEAKEKALAEARTQLAEIRESEAREAGRREAEEKAKAQAKAEPAPAPAAKPAEPKEEPRPAEPVPAASPAPEIPQASAAPGPDPRESFRRILDTMGAAGCEACAASLVIKREMRRFNGALHG